MPYKQTIPKKKNNLNKVNPYHYQDSHQEKVIHSGWEKGNHYRFVLEGTGDIFREFAKNPEHPSNEYIYEKINRINRHFELMELQKKYYPETQIHPEDSIQYARENNPDKFKLMEQYWESQPVYTKKQELARQLNLAMIRGDYAEAKRLIKEIEKK